MTRELRNRTAVPRSGFRVPSSCSGFGVLHEPRTENTNPEPGTENLELSVLGGRFTRRAEFFQQAGDVTGD
jgi:hypothetical protein